MPDDTPHTPNEPVDPAASTGEHSLDEDAAVIDAAIHEAEAAVANTPALGSAEQVLAAERDEYLDALRRLQADFENYRKRVARETADAAAKGAERLIAQLLPVLDAADNAVAHSGDAADANSGIHALWRLLFDTLGKEGLERLDPEGAPFDPNQHDAVMHEDGEGEAVVVDVLRAGYRWKGSVVRPAMVKVRGG